MRTNRSDRCVGRSLLAGWIGLLALATLVAIVGCSSGAPQEENTGSVEQASLVATGVDYSFARPSPSGLKSGGYTFACRYLSPPPNGKNLSKAEADELWAAGVDVVANFEEAADNALSGKSQGVTDAKLADSQSKSDGIPTGRPIYFSVDFDASTSDFTAIDAYFDGVASVIGIGRTGAYGGYAVIKHLFDVGKIRWGWQTYAWSGGDWDSRAQLRQVLNDITAAGDSACCDKDEAWAKDFGQWHAASIDPCASAANGYYCGQSPQWAGGTKDHLYDCEDGVTKSNVDCPGGCIVEASGTPDKCGPYDAGVDGGEHDGDAEEDAGDARSDAGPGEDASSDASKEPSDADGGEGAPPDDGKGGCSIGEPGSAPQSAADLAWLGALALAVVLARRRAA